MLKIAGLNAGYQDLQVLRDVDLRLGKGRVGVLMGPNGAGKSTLLKSIFNLVTISSGSITWEGTELTGLPAYRLLAEDVAYVPQGKVNFGTLTVEENLFMATSSARMARGERQERFNVVYREFPVLQQRRRELAFRLSGGQQQMLALGRALMNVPKLLLLDEPSLGLAPKLVKQVFAKIQHINQAFGTTILIVEHNIKSVLDIADVGYVMVGGQIIESGPAVDLKKSPVLQKVFVGTFE